MEGRAKVEQKSISAGGKLWDPRLLGFVFLEAQVLGGRKLREGLVCVRRKGGIN